MKKTLPIIISVSLLGTVPLFATPDRAYPQIPDEGSTSSIIDQLPELFLQKAKGSDKDKDKDKDKNEKSDRGRGDKDKGKADKDQPSNDGGGKKARPKEQKPAPPQGNTKPKSERKPEPKSEPKSDKPAKVKKDVEMTKERPAKPATNAPAAVQKPSLKPKERPTRPAPPSSEKPEMKVPPVAIPSKSKPRPVRPDPTKVTEKSAPPSSVSPRPETMKPNRPGQPQTTQRDLKREDKVGSRKAPAPPSKETKKVLQEDVHRDRKKDVEQALRIDDRGQASDLVRSILGQVIGGPSAVDRRPSGPERDQHFDDDHQRYGRLPSDQVGRSTREREQSVDFLIRRFAGGASLSDAPEGFHSGRDVHRTDYPRDHQTHYHGPNNRQRVVCYPSRNDIPAILLASVILNRVQAQPFAQSSYRPGQPSVDDDYYRNIPPNYQSEGAYAVSYTVDPESVISREDIIFQQGSSAFADAYSYDLVVDLAEAMKAPQLQNEKFVIEGHASAEGDYESNLRLSQERAERISRDLVNLGVAPEQLLPVGYGEAEAQYPGDAREPLRSLDRRVVVFRMADE